MTAWIEPQPIEPPEALVRVAGHPLVARILARRGLNTADAAHAFLYPDAYTPAPPTELPDLAFAAQRLRRAVEKEEQILVWGDFDVDGQTATSLLVATLRQLGAKIQAYIPHRLHEGHGIKRAALRERLTGVDLVLTCDTGVSEHESIAYARSQGVTVLVTDHHELPAELPPTEAIVNPKRLPPHHPLRELPGVGVAYKLVQELYGLMAQRPERVEEALDLVALGIVADVATQVGDTRYLLQRGMHRLRRTQRMGLQALMHSAQINPAHLTTDHIGFGIGPRLNALGRLGDANLAVELLTTDDLTRARVLAAQLEVLNSRRRVLTTQIYAAAQEQVAKNPDILDRHALVVSGPGWHPGVIGIVASRLAETYDLPTVLISEGDDGKARGSARSVPGVDIHAAISTAGEHLTAFGGHAGAAGLSLPVEHIAGFRRALSRAVDDTRDRTAIPGLIIDAMLPWSELSLELVDTLNALAPFGEGNPPLMLVSQGLELTGDQIFGRDLAHRRLSVRDEYGTTHEVTWWRGAEHTLPTGQFDLAYHLKASDYRGETHLQIEYVAARLVAALPTEVVRPTVRVVDQRTVPDPLRVLNALRAREELVVWAEGYPSDRSPGQRRDQLESAAGLVIWTPPPSPRELQSVLDRLSPQTVYLFARPNEGIDPQRFTARLAGFIKYTLQSRNGVADLQAIAASSGQRIDAVRAGIYLFQARGFIRIVEEEAMTMRLARGDGKQRPDLEDSQARLRAVLQETAAYRAYFARTDPTRLIE